MQKLRPKIKFWLDYNIKSALEEKMFNAPQTSFTDQRLNGDQIQEGTISNFKHLFKHFLHEFDIDHVKIYMKEISRMINEKKYSLTVQLTHIKA